MEPKMNEKSLEEIKGILVDIRSILLITNAKDIENYKKEFLNEKSEQVKIYKLCTNLTTEEIAKKIKKKDDYVYTNIRRLREKGLIKSTNKNGKLTHEQII